jgi:hypothetical protein
MSDSTGKGVGAGCPLKLVQVVAVILVQVVTVCRALSAHNSAFMHLDLHQISACLPVSLRPRTCKVWTLGEHTDLPSVTPGCELYGPVPISLDCLMLVVQSFLLCRLKTATLCAGMLGV